MPQTDEVLNHSRMSPSPRNLLWLSPRRLSLSSFQPAPHKHVVQGRAPVFEHSSMGISHPKEDSWDKDRFGVSRLTGLGCHRAWEQRVGVEVGGNWEMYLFGLRLVRRRQGDN